MVGVVSLSVALLTALSLPPVFVKAKLSSIHIDEEQPFDWADVGLQAELRALFGTLQIHAVHEDGTAKTHWRLFGITRPIRRGKRHDEPGEPKGQEKEDRPQGLEEAFRPRERVSITGRTGSHSVGSDSTGNNCTGSNSTGTDCTDRTDSTSTATNNGENTNGNSAAGRSISQRWQGSPPRRNGCLGERKRNLSCP